MTSNDSPTEPESRVFKVLCSGELSSNQSSTMQVFDGSHDEEIHFNVLPGGIVDAEENQGCPKKRVSNPSRENDIIFPPCSEIKYLQELAAMNSTKYQERLTNNSLPKINDANLQKLNASVHRFQSLVSNLTKENDCQTAEIHTLQSRCLQAQNHVAELEQVIAELRTRNLQLKNDRKADKCIIQKLVRKIQRLDSKYHLLAEEQHLQKLLHHEYVIRKWTQSSHNESQIPQDSVQESSANVNTSNSSVLQEPPMIRRHRLRRNRDTTWSLRRDVADSIRDAKHRSPPRHVDLNDSMENSQKTEPQCEASELPSATSSQPSKDKEMNNPKQSESLLENADYSSPDRSMKDECKDPESAIRRSEPDTEIDRGVKSDGKSQRRIIAIFHRPNHSNDDDDNDDDIEEEKDCTPSGTPIRIRKRSFDFWRKPGPMDSRSETKTQVTPENHRKKKGLLDLSESPDPSYPAAAAEAASLSSTSTAAMTVTSIEEGQTDRRGAQKLKSSMRNMGKLLTFR